ncbi:DUF6789 family protein [Burkholderia glumae]|uniref:Uncharacterized protein n=2 Tax=Burkholderia glumae TaxID=337 RepID=A0AAP9Y5Y2_BURGL|nr:DUF6789 family protein [Burkholderia glumae]ACR32747.1 Hypothetical protein bglu_2p0880 [Burkholderia glumae BGR1]AJY62417.1 hypothetical protein KS03_5841 [Burkholderia glumae LMG 2196 = ATCC 33617]MCM2485758.1 hypothetical protein [Burkholderia glumae]MCM2511596.1 hypothetical protein [Burkholderia glumae]MCM2541689.1 hypothetical protein [Burkholderia glumae]
MSNAIQNEKPAIGRGMLAGFVATVVLSILIMMKHAMGVMPELDPIGMISHMLGMSTPVVGWVMHFMIGIVWGIAFASTSRMFPGPFWLKGMLFAVVPWLVMMFAMMPMAGAGFFGLDLGMAAPVMTLMLHLVFGAVLGAVYGTRASQVTPA